jgi:VWFA-related protein
MKLALLTIFAISLAAQEPRFAVHSRLVQLPVTVTDSEGRAVDGLGDADFIILDNGIARKATVDTIGTGVAPIALAVAVQGSGLSAAVIAKVQKIGGLIQPLITGEAGCAALLSFSTQVRWLQECTNDAGALDRAFQQLRPGIDAKRARMLDAADQAVAHLSEKPNMRRVLLIIAESRDRGSEAELAYVTAAAQSQGVVVYFATYSQFKTAFTFDDRPLTTTRTVTEPTPKVWETADNEPYSYNNPIVVQQDQSVDLLTGIKELARLHQANAAQILTGGTGGTIFPFVRQKGLEEAIQKLGSELHSQYVISFVQEDAAAGYHNLDVRTTGHEGLRVRSRPGYWYAGAER